MTATPWDADVDFACPGCKGVNVDARQELVKLTTATAQLKERFTSESGRPAIRWAGVACAVCGKSYTIEAVQADS